MNTHNIHCQNCDSFIYSELAGTFFDEYFSCPQVNDNDKLLKKVYPKAKFVVTFEKRTIKSISIEDDSIPEKYKMNLVDHIRSLFEGNGIYTSILDHRSYGRSVESIELKSKSFFVNFVMKDGKFISRHKKKLPFRKKPLPVRYRKFDPFPSNRLRRNTFYLSTPSKRCF